jgi:hypothetical protein
MMRGVAGNKLSLREFVVAMILTFAVAAASYRFIETPIRTGAFSAWRRRTRSGTARGPKLLLNGGLALAVVVGLILGVTLMRAPLEQNEIAQALTAGQEFTTDLLAVDEIPKASTTTSTSTSTSTVPPSTTVDPGVAVAPVVTTPDGSAVPDSVVPPTTAPPTTAAPATTVPVSALPTVAPVTQLGVVSSLEGLVPLTVPPTATGFPWVALGDSVMLGAAEELQARGFQVDAQVSRQMKNYVPTMAALRDNGTFGSVVVIHLGTNGGFSQETLDEMLATVANVPVVLLLTGKADRGWIADNNARIRAVPATHPNVTVVDWEVLSAGCQGRCFYDDNIHLTQSGQNYFADIIGKVLGQI